MVQCHPMPDQISLTPVQMRIMIAHLENHQRVYGDPKNIERKRVIAAAKRDCLFQLKKNRQSRK